jgi:hypothetical protein
MQGYRSVGEVQGDDALINCPVKLTVRLHKRPDVGNGVDDAIASVPATYPERLI